MPLRLLVKWEVVSPNSREGQLESISITLRGGGGVMFFSHFMLFPTFLEKNIWEYKAIIVSPVRSTYGGYYGLVVVTPRPRPQTLQRSHDNLKNPYRIASIFYM